MNSPESLNQLHLRLLTKFPTDGTPIHTKEFNSSHEISILAELLDENYIAGCPLPNEVGKVIEIANMTLTGDGRRYIEFLHDQESKKSFIGFISANRTKAYKWIFGIIGTVFAALLVKFILWTLA